VLRQLGPDIQWVDSYVAADNTLRRPQGVLPSLTRGHA